MCARKATPTLILRSAAQRRVSKDGYALLLRRKALVHALPFVVADDLLVVLEIHAVVAPRELAGLHVEQHGLDRLGRVHHGVEAEHRAVEAELAQLLHASGSACGRPSADCRSAERRTPCRCASAHRGCAAPR